MAIVLDTNVIVRSRGEFGSEKLYLDPMVIEEVESTHGENILNNLSYTARSPSDSSVEKVEKLSERINSPTSETDESIVALAWETSSVLVTDDKAIQNLCLYLDVEFDGFMDDPLDQELRWEKLCSNCGNEVTGSRCSRCGSRTLRRRQVQSS